MSDKLKQVAIARFEDARTYGEIVKDEIDMLYRAYHRDPDLFGERRAGRSHVMSTDVSDTMRWLSAQVVDMFVASGRFGEFRPKSSEDIEAAKQETNVVDHIFWKENNGFLNITSMVMDAMLAFNCITHTYYEEQVSELEENYENLDEQEYLKILADDDVEIVEQEERVIIEAIEAPTPEGEIIVVQPAVKEYDCTLRRKETKNKICVDTLKPEDVFVSSGHKSLDLKTAEAVFYRERTTKGELVADGYDEEDIDMALYGDALMGRRIGESDFRGRTRSDRGHEGADEAGFADDSLRSLDVLYGYVRADLDDTGIPELYYVVMAGDAQELIYHEKADAIFMQAGTVIIAPHSFYGNSPAESAYDIQELKTTVMRQGMDNLYASNNPRPVVDEELVDVESLYDSTHGAPIFTQQGAQVGQFAVANVGGQVLPYLDYFNQMLQRRTGVNESTMGLDPSSLSHATDAVGQAMLNTSQLLVKMMARTFAETCLRQIYQDIHALASKHLPSDYVAELNGEYVSVNPRNWKKRTDFDISVGIGHADRNEKMGMLNTILAFQREALQAGLPLTDQNKIYNTIKDMMQVANMHGVDNYFTDPSTLPPAPPADPNADPVEAYKQVEEGKLIIATHTERIETERALALKKMELDYKREKDLLDRMHDEKMQQQKISYDAGKTTAELMKDA